MFGQRSGQGPPLPTDSTALLQQIAQSTAEISRWMKYLVGAVVVLILVTAVVVL